MEQKAGKCALTTPNPFALQVKAEQAKHELEIVARAQREEAERKLRLVQDRFVECLIATTNIKLGHAAEDGCMELDIMALPAEDIDFRPRGPLDRGGFAVEDLSRTSREVCTYYLTLGYVVCIESVDPGALDHGHIVLRWGPNDIKHPPDHTE